jgi:hypothetical protein
MTETSWKALDLFVKGFLAVIITAAITVYGIWSQAKKAEIAEASSRLQRELAEENARLRALVEFNSTQKTLDVNVGMQLFSKFVDYYLKPTSDTPEAARQTLLLLRLLGVNFQDVPINLKPLFEDLDSRLREPDQAMAASAPELRRQLVGIAQEIANRQAYRMSFLGGILSQPVRVSHNEEVSFAKQGIPLTLKVTAIEEDHVAISLKEEGLANPREIGPFTVSYFDVPIVDNIKLDKSTRIAVLLMDLDSEKKTAQVRMVSFLHDLATDRFDIKEMTRDIYTPRFGN